MFPAVIVLSIMILPTITMISRGALVASLAVLIYNFSGMPFANQMELAWAAALVLVLMVLTANLIGQSLSRKQINSSQEVK